MWEEKTIMKKKKILALMVIVTVLLLSFLTGCGSSKQPAATATNTIKEVKMLTAVTGGKDEAEMKLFKEKLEKATGLTITMDKPASDYDNVLTQKLQAGDKYDLVYCGQEQIPFLAKQGALKDITSQVQKSKILSDTSIIPQS